jgi:cold shock CspA family protein
MSSWKAGKILWFDELAGEGYVVDDKGDSFYVHHSSIKNGSVSKSTKKNTHIHRLKVNQPVRFTLYKNSYLSQVEALETEK